MQTIGDGDLRHETDHQRRAMRPADGALSPDVAQRTAVSQIKTNQTPFAATPVAATVIPQVAISRELMSKTSPTARIGENALSEPVQRLFSFIDGELPGKPAAIEARSVQHTQVPAEPSMLGEVKGGGADTLAKAEQNMRGVALGLLPQQVAQSLARLAMSRGRFAIALSPQSLGSIDIEFSEHRGEVSIAMVAREATTRELLEQMLPRLRESLSDAGVSLADLDIRREPQQQQRRDPEAMLAASSTGTQQIDEQSDEQGTLPWMPENASFHVLV
jgi:hypothetical protein